MLKYTADQARTRIVDLIGVEGIPNPWWPAATGNDCVGFALERLGLRRPRDFTTRHVSIAAFRAHYGWDQIPVGRLRPGDLVAENWTGAGEGRTPEHLEYVYSVDHDGGQIVTISANTGPRPGTARPRGVWKKTRPIDGHLLFGIRPPYRDPKPSPARRRQVRLAAGFLNTTLPHDTDLPRTDAADDGVADRRYWRLVQTWGRARDLYGPGYRVDGVPGPRTRGIERAVLSAAKAATRAQK